MFIWLKHKPTSSKIRETDHFAVVSSSFPELYVIDNKELLFQFSSFPATY